MSEDKKIEINIGSEWRAIEYLDNYAPDGTRRHVIANKYHGTDDDSVEYPPLPAKNTFDDFA